TGLRRLAVEVLEDRTTPSFLAPLSYPGRADLLAAGDFNNDRLDDIVAADQTAKTVTVRLGSPDGILRTTPPSATGNTPYGLAVGDFNGDGKLDVVTANGSDLSIILGKGDGTFQPPQSLALPRNQSTGAVAVAVGDMNNDGKLDLVVGRFVTGGSH